MKTKETRACELFEMVHGKHQAAQFHPLNPIEKAGWIKLGKLVLRLEEKWRAAKKSK